MQQLTGDDLKQIQIEILDVVAAFCKEHEIHYFLDCGTLLGAVRHQGYIPWDDDIDVGMLRPDYDRFMALFNAENNRYQMICNELDATCPYPHGKVLDTQTVLYEPDEEHGIKGSVNIDVFVYDNAPADDTELERMYDQRDRYRMLNLLQNQMIGTQGIVKDIVKWTGYHVLRHFPVACFATRMVELSKSLNDRETGYVGNLTCVARIKAPIRIFDAWVQLPFEGKMYDAPAGYDKWLTCFYGDYMQLPPVEKRVSHHMFVAYRLQEISMNSEMTIAILGGMGTYATIHAFEQYAAIFPAEREWDRPRLIIDNRCTMPSRVRAFLYGDRKDELIADMSESLFRLCEMGGSHTRIILACNSSHLFLPYIYAQHPELENHVVNIIQATANAVQESGVDSIYLLGSEATIDSGVFAEPLGRVGVSYSAPTQEVYPVLRDCIEAVKQNHYTEETERQFLSLVEGQENVILGCTELPILYQRYRDRMPACKVYDPVESALLQIRREYMANQTEEQ